MIGRRFIAGAICPNCAKLDTLYLESSEAMHVRRCTRCDFTDSIDRVASSDAQIQAVQILEPGQIRPPPKPQSKS